MRQEDVRPWQVAEIGAKYFLGDAARTAESTALLEVAGGGATLAMQPHTVLRFGKKGGDRRLVVEAGAVDLTGNGSYGLQIGEVRLGNGTVRIAAGAGKNTIELRVGEAQLATASGTEVLHVGIRNELGVGPISVVPTVDAGVPDSAAAPPPPPVEPERVALVFTGRVEADRPSEPGWRALAPGTAQLEAGAKVRLGRGATAKLTARGTTLELGGGASAAIADDLAFSLESGRASASASADSAVTLPGGAMALRGTAGGTADARFDAGPRETRVTMQRAGGTLSGAPGTSLAMRRGESAVITRAGAIRVIDAIPSTFDFRVAAGESLTVHDPRPPTAVQFQFGARCADGGVIELDRDARFLTPRQSGGKEVANLRVERGAWWYRLRCTVGGTEGRPVAGGRISVVRDAATRALPKLRPPNDIEADGRRWSITYQSVLPDLRVQVRGTGARYRLHVAQGGKAEQFDSAQSVITIPGTKLKEGTYTYWAEIDGVKQNKISTLVIDFDQTAAQVYIESPQNGVPWSDDIDVRGAVLPGWTAAVESVPIPIDRQRRFSARVGAPSGAALAIRVSHPQRGIHYYLRRAK